MSEQSQFSEDINVGWIQWFCGLEDHVFFCQVNEEFIKNEFNLYGLKKRVSKYNEALKMILRSVPPAEQQVDDPQFLQLYQHATELYGLIHARYITSPEGLAIMRERYLAGRFGNCPRVMCEKQNVLPIAISQDLKIARVKIYCPRCKDIYAPKKKSADADGAYFGTSFPHLLLMSYPDLKPYFKRQQFVPKMFGFKIQQPLAIVKGEEENQSVLVNKIENKQQSLVVEKEGKKKNKKKK